MALGEERPDALHPLVAGSCFGPVEDRGPPTGRRPRRDPSSPRRSRCPRSRRPCRPPRGRGGSRAAAPRCAATRGSRRRPCGATRRTPRRRAPRPRRRPPRAAAGARSLRARSSGGTSSSSVSASSVRSVSSRVGGDAARPLAEPVDPDAPEPELVARGDVVEERRADVHMSLARCARCAGRTRPSAGAPACRSRSPARRPPRRTARRSAPARRR